MSFKKGNTPWNKGLTKETDKRIYELALGKTGKKRSVETKLKISESLKGNKHPFYGKHLSEKTKEKIRKARTNKNPENLDYLFTEDKKQIIFGSLLGDASLRPSKINCYLEETHGIKQKEYLMWKSRYLDFLNPKITNKNNNGYEAVKLQTSSYPFLRKLYNKIYWDKRKRVKLFFIDQLGDLGLTVWYLDDGHVTIPEDLIRLSTDCFNYNEHLILRRFFNKKYGILPRIGERRGKHYLLFNKKDSKLLLSIFKKNIRKYSIPSTMFYKLGSLWDGNLEKIKIAYIKKINYKRKWRKKRSEIRKIKKVKKIAIRGEKIKYLYWQKGLSSTDIGKMMGYSGVGIRKIMKKLKISLRTPNEAHSKERNGFYGRRHTKESREKISENRWGNRRKL